MQMQVYVEIDSHRLCVYLYLLYMYVAYMYFVWVKLELDKEQYKCHLLMLENNNFKEREVRARHREMAQTLGCFRVHST